LLLLLDQNTRLHNIKFYNKPIVITY